MRPTLHLVGLPHTTTTKDITVCAFTTKATKFCRMMENDEIILYWGDRNDAPVKEHVVLHTEEERKAWYGDLDPNILPAVCGNWDWQDESWRTFNTRAIEELKERVEPHDLILLTGGWASHPIAQAFPNHLVAEWAAGYSGWFAPYVCFESYAWKSHCYGTHNLHDGRFYDTVIPNFFDPDEWQVQDGKDDYLVYLGRLIYRKGVSVAADIARYAGMPLYVAGSGAAEVSEGLIVCHDGTRIEGDVHYVGTVGVEERSALVGRARALLCPTLYIEPFGAVAVEAQLCGTQSIATDWGAFPELIPAEFRFHTIAEGVQAVERAIENSEKPGWAETLQENALAEWSLDAVRPRYERWFDQLLGLWDGGFYAPPRARV